MRKALVALPDEVWDIIDRDLGDRMGRGYSDTIRSIVLAWLSENGYMAKGGRKTVKQETSPTKRPSKGLGDLGV
jgi:hypothetical protein